MVGEMEQKHLEATRTDDMQRTGQRATDDMQRTGQHATDRTTRHRTASPLEAPGDVKHSSARGACERCARCARACAGRYHVVARKRGLQLLPLRLDGVVGFVRDQPHVCTRAVALYALRHALAHEEPCL